MRSSVLRRASRPAITSCLVALAGCSGPGEPGETSTRPPPEAPVSRCTVASDTVVSSGDASSSAIAARGDRFAVAWSDREVRVTVLDHDGQRLHEGAIPASGGTPSAPSITALHEGGYLVAWQEQRGGSGLVRAARVDDEGALRGEPFIISANAGAEAHPDVADTRGGAVVAWTEPSGAYVAQVKGNGIVGKVALPGGTQSAVAASDRGAVTVWSAGAEVGFRPIDSARVGAAAPPTTMLRRAAGRANLPRVAAAPNGEHAIVWEDTRAGAEQEAIYLATIDPDRRASSEVAVSPPGGSADYPDVTFLGDRAAVTYYQFRDGPPAVYLTLIDPASGKALSELRVSPRGAARFPRVAWGGGGTLGITYTARGGPAHLAVIECH